MFATFAPKVVRASTSSIVKVSCEKTGTVYYQDTKTGDTAWTPEALKKS
jgi:hypothetical protein